MIYLDPEHLSTHTTDDVLILHSINASIVSDKVLSFDVDVVLLPVFAACDFFSVLLMVA